MSRYKSARSRQFCVSLKPRKSPGRIRDPWLPAKLSRRLDHVAIGPPRHHAILQLARSRQIAREPDADGNQDDGNHKAGDGPLAIVGLVVWLVAGHLRANIRWKRRRASTTAERGALRLQRADGLYQPMMPRRRDMADPMAGRHDTGRAMALPVGAKRRARYGDRIGKANRDRNRGADQYRRDHHEHLAVPPRSRHCGNSPLRCADRTAMPGFFVVIEITCDQIPHRRCPNLPPARGYEPFPDLKGARRT